MQSPDSRLGFMLRSAAVLLAVGVASGCSFSASSESSSKSISSPFTSSSASSESDATKYKNEVAEYASAYVSADGGSVDAFKSGLSKLAARRGISDWEASPDTWSSVGRGLANTKLSEAEALAYGMSWSGGDEGRMELMRAAFSAAR